MKKAFNNRRDILTAVVGSILLTGYIAKSYSEYLDNLPLPLATKDDIKFSQLSKNQQLNEVHKHKAYIQCAETPHGNEYFFSNHEEPTRRLVFGTWQRNIPCLNP